MYLYGGFKVSTVFHELKLFFFVWLHLFMYLCYLFITLITVEIQFFVIILDQAW